MSFDKFSVLQCSAFNFNTQKRQKMLKHGKAKNCKNENLSILIPYEVYNHFWWQNIG